MAKFVEANNVRKVGVLFRVERMSAKRPLSLIEIEAETGSEVGTRRGKPIKANSAELTHCRSRIASGRAGRLRRRGHAQMVFIS